MPRPRMVAIMCSENACFTRSGISQAAFLRRGDDLPGGSGPGVGAPGRPVT